MRRVSSLSNRMLKPGRVRVRLDSCCYTSTGFFEYVPFRLLHQNVDAGDMVHTYEVNLAILSLSEEQEGL